MTKTKEFPQINATQYQDLEGAVPEGLGLVVTGDMKIPMSELANILKTSHGVGSGDGSGNTGGNGNTGSGVGATTYTHRMSNFPAQYTVNMNENAEIFLTMNAYSPIVAQNATRQGTAILTLISPSSGTIYEPLFSDSGSVPFEWIEGHSMPPMPARGYAWSILARTLTSNGPVYLAVEPGGPFFIENAPAQGSAWGDRTTPQNEYDAGRDGNPNQDTGAGSVPDLIGSKTAQTEGNVYNPFGSYLRINEGSRTYANGDPIPATTGRMAIYQVGAISGLAFRYKPSFFAQNNAIMSLTNGDGKDSLIVGTTASDDILIKFFAAGSTTSTDIQLAREWLQGGQYHNIIIGKEISGATETWHVWEDANLVGSKSVTLDIASGTDWFLGGTRYVASGYMNMSLAYAVGFSEFNKANVGQINSLLTGRSAI